MATKFGTGVNYTPYTNPYNMNLVGQAMAYKQKKVDTNREKISDTIQSMMSIPIDKEVSRRYFEDRINSIVQDVNDVYRGADLSSDAVGKRLSSSLVSAIDENVMNAAAGSIAIRRYNAQVDAIKRNNPEKYSKINELIGIMPAQEWLNDNDPGSRLGRLDYTPYFDYNKWAKDSVEVLMKKPKGSKVTLPAYDSNGKVVEGYLVERNVDQLTPGEVKTYLSAIMPESARQQMQIEGRYLALSNPSLFGQSNTEDFILQNSKRYDDQIAVYESKLSMASNDEERRTLEYGLSSLKGQKEQMAADIRSMMSGGFNGDAAGAYLVKTQFLDGASRAYSYSSVKETLKPDEIWKHRDKQRFDAWKMREQQQHDLLKEDIKFKNELKKGEIEFEYNKELARIKNEWRNGIGSNGRGSPSSGADLTQNRAIAPSFITEGSPDMQEVEAASTIQYRKQQEVYGGLSEAASNLQKALNKNPQSSLLLTKTIREGLGGDESVDTMDEALEYVISHINTFEGMDEEIKSSVDSYLLAKNRASILSKEMEEYDNIYTSISEDQKRYIVNHLDTNTAGSIEVKADNGRVYKMRDAAKLSDGSGVTFMGMKPSDFLEARMNAEFGSLSFAFDPSANQHYGASDDSFGAKVVKPKRVSDMTMEDRAMVSKSLKLLGHPNLTPEDVFVSDNRGSVVVNPSLPRNAYNFFSDIVGLSGKMPTDGVFGSDDVVSLASDKGVRREVFERNAKMANEILNQNYARNTSSRSYNTLTYSKIGKGGRSTATGFNQVVESLIPLYNVMLEEDRTLGRSREEARTYGPNYANGVRKPLSPDKLTSVDIKPYYTPSSPDKPLYKVIYHANDGDFTISDVTEEMLRNKGIAVDSRYDNVKMDGYRSNIVSCAIPTDVQGKNSHLLSTSGHLVPNISGAVSYILNTDAVKLAANFAKDNPSYSSVFADVINNVADVLNRDASGASGLNYLKANVVGEGDKMVGYIYDGNGNILGHEVIVSGRDELGDLEKLSVRGGDIASMVIRNALNNYLADVKDYMANTGGSLDPSVIPIPPVLMGVINYIKKTRTNSGLEVVPVQED